MLKLVDQILRLPLENGGIGKRWSFYLGIHDLPHKPRTVELLLDIVDKMKTPANSGRAYSSR
jgi:hypothetical protein